MPREIAFDMRELHLTLLVHRVLPPTPELCRPSVRGVVLSGSYIERARFQQVLGGDAPSAA